MIELIVEDRCTACNLCVEVCPTNVFEAQVGGGPLIARPQDCQTCFLCELYCRADAIYVGPHATAPEPVDEAAIVASGLLGRYRRDSGWDEWAGRYPNEQWMMEHVFRRAAVGGGPR